MWIELLLLLYIIQFVCQEIASIFDVDHLVDCIRVQWGWIWWWFIGEEGIRQFCRGNFDKTCRLNKKWSVTKWIKKSYWMRILDENAEIKFQSTKNKSQINHNIKSPWARINASNETNYLEFYFWRLKFICYFSFGFWNFVEATSSVTAMPTAEFYTSWFVLKYLIL